MSARRARGGVLVAGGGFAGGYVARLLGKGGATIVSPENFMLYTPMLPEAASGTLEPRHVVVPLRMMCPHAELILGRVTALGAEARRVHVETETGELEVEYEELVLALGAVPRTAPDSGARRARARVQEPCRRHPSAEPRAPAPRGRRRPAGRCRAGAQLRLRWGRVRRHRGARRAARPRPRRASPLSEPAPGATALGARRLRSDDSPGDSHRPRLLRRAGARQARRRLRVGTTLESAEDGAVALSDGTRLETSTLVWTAGVSPHPLLAELGFPLDEPGRIRVEPTLQVEGREHVWALGDCASVPNQATPDHPDPPTSQHALRQARRLAANLRSEPRPYRYRMLGQVATLRRHKGIADVFGVHLRGFPGWFVTRTYHLFQLPLLTRKLRVVVDWTVALFFRRDIAELSMLGHPRPLSGDGAPRTTAPP